MRNLLAIVLTVATLLTFTACGSEDENELRDETDSANSTVSYEEVEISEDEASSGTTSELTSQEKFKFRWELNGDTITISGEGDLSDYILDDVPRKESIKKAVILDGITAVGSDVFENWSSLVSVEMSDSVTDIGYSAFGGTPILESESNWEGDALYLNDILLRVREDASFSDFAIKEGTRIIGSGALQEQENLKSITIPDSVTTIGRRAFADCENLETVILGASTTTIRLGAFIECGSLTNVILPEGLTDIHSEAFKECWALENVTIPESVTFIGSFAFTAGSVKRVNISSLEAWCNITFESWTANPLSQGTELYLNGEKVEHLVIPDGIEVIRDHAFFGYKGMTSATLSDSVETISYGAFGECSNLASITIPCSVKSIEKFVFDECESLTDITYEGTKAQWEAIEKGTHWDDTTGSYDAGIFTVHCTDGDIENPQ